MAFVFEKVPERKVMREINLIVIHCSATRADRCFTEHDVTAAHRCRGFKECGYHF